MKSVDPFEFELLIMTLSIKPFIHDSLANTSEVNALELFENLKEMHSDVFENVKSLTTLLCVTRYEIVNYTIFHSFQTIKCCFKL